MHTTKWSDRLALDIALCLEGSGDTMPEILQRHGATPDNLLTFTKDSLFQNKITNYRDEITNNGLSFKLKAKTQAEELLMVSWQLIHSPDVSASVKADLIKSTVKWAGLEPKGDEKVSQGGQGGVTITINLGGEKKEIELVDITPREPEPLEIEYVQE